MAVSATTSNAPVVTGADVARPGRRPLPVTPVGGAPQPVGGSGYAPAAGGPAAGDPPRPPHGAPPAARGGRGAGSRRGRRCWRWRRVPGASRRPWR